MGQDKPFLRTDGEPLIEHALSRLRPVCAEVRILSGPPNLDRDARLSCYARLVPDAASAHHGPLAALAAALHDCSTGYALLLAVDQPAVSTQMLQQLALRGLTTRAAAACFQQEGEPEPLPLLVTKALQHGIARAVHAGERRLLQTVQACAGQGSRLLLIPAPAPGLFLNLNTPEDFQRWQTRGISNQSAPRASEPSNGR